MHIQPIADFVWTADWANFFSKQWLHFIVVRPLKIVTAYGKVNAVGERKLPAACHQMDIHVRMPRLEVWPPRYQPAHEQRGLARQYPAFFLPGIGTQFVDGIADEAKACSHGF